MVATSKFTIASYRKVLPMISATTESKDQ